MVEVTVPGFVPSLGSIGILYALYYIYWQLTVGASRRRLMREHGAAKPLQLPDWDPIFGLGNVMQVMRWARARTLLASGPPRFRGLGTNTFATQAVGSRFIMTIEPEILKQVQAVQFKNFALPARRKNAFVPFLGAGIFNSDGAAWQHSRDMLRPNFVRSQVGDVDTYQAHVDHLIALIPRDGSTVDLQPLFFRQTMDTSTEMLFGESTNTLVPAATLPGAFEFANAFDRSQMICLDRARWGLPYTIFPDRTYDAYVKQVHRFLDQLVARAFARHADRKASSTRYIFADELITRTTDRLEVRGQLLNVLLAGRDTTASLLSNVWFELSKRPDVFRTLKAEIDALAPPGTNLTFELIKSAKYLRAVLNESLRLYPVVPGNAREALVDTVMPIGGGPDGKGPMLVEKGTAIGWSLYSMHRRKDLYGEDAAEFEPERWLGEKGLRPGWEYLPFNGGPRICLGQQFALTEASYTTIRLIQEFETLESRDPGPWVEGLSLTCTGYNGCKVALMPRQ